MLLTSFLNGPHKRYIIKKYTNSFDKPITLCSCQLYSIEFKFACGKADLICDFYKVNLHHFLASAFISK